MEALALNAGVFRCAEGKLSLADVCDTVLTSSHWFLPLSTVVSAPIFTRTKLCNRVISSVASRSE